MHPALTYALLALVAAAFVFGLWVDGRRDHPRFGAVARFGFAIQLAAMFGAWATLRTGAGDDPSALVAGASQPTFVEFYSDTCPPCLLARPTVDRLEHAYRGRLRVVRVNTSREDTWQFAQRFAVRATPSYFLVDATGATRWSQVGGSPDLDAFNRAFTALR